MTRCGTVAASRPRRGATSPRRLSL
jgi:hypothetical protein